MQNRVQPLRLQPVAAALSQQAVLCRERVRDSSMAAAARKVPNWVLRVRFPSQRDFLGPPGSSFAGTVVYDSRTKRYGCFSDEDSDPALLIKCALANFPSKRYFLGLLGSSFAGTEVCDLDSRARAS